MAGYQAVVKRVLLSCPSDIDAGHIDAVFRAVRRWNKSNGPSARMSFEAIHWQEDVASGVAGRAQELINEQLVDSCEFGIVLLWSRLGTPTGTFRSGIDEELTRLLSQGRPVAVLRETTPVPIAAAEGAVAADRYVRELQAQGALTLAYQDSAELASLVDRQLDHWSASERQAVPRPSTPAPAPAPWRVSGSRPGRLSYEAWCGIYVTYFPEPSRPSDFHDLFRRIIDWYQGPGDFRVLDTFLTDSWSQWTVASMLEKAWAHDATIRILLADPSSPYADLRARALGHGEGESRAIEGLRMLSRALDSAAGRRTQVGPPAQMLREAMSGLPIEVRFYDLAPSGPMYFIGDLLWTGRYPTKQSSLTAPWQLIVKDPEVVDDLYGSYDADFEAVWADSTGG